MNVVFVVYNAEATGAVLSSTRRQAEFLATRGHGVTLISNQSSAWNGVESRLVKSPCSQWGKTLDYLANGLFRRLPRKLHTIDCRAVLPFAEMGAAALPEIDRLIQSGACDCVVLCQHPCILGLGNLPPHIPITLVAHGDIFSHPWRSFPLPLTVMYRIAATRAYRRAQLVIPVGSALAARAISLGTEADAVQVIPNGIDPMEIGWDESAEAPAPHDSPPYRLLFIGRLVAEKAVDVLLRALAQLPVGDFTLDIVGDGELRAELSALSRKLALEPYVTFHGQQRRRELGRFYQQADLVCLPSLSEAQPVVTLEAMVAGRPVIASRVGGVPDSVRDGQTGILVTPGEAKELAEAIVRLAGDGPLRRQMCNNAKELSHEFAWPGILNRFESALESTVASASK